MTFEDSFLVPDSAKSDGTTLRFDVRMPWYRSMPVSVVVKLEVAVNGVAVPAEQIRFTINGGTYSLAELAPRWDDVWFVQDPATVEVPDLRFVAEQAVTELTDSRSTPPDEVTVSASMDLRNPYILLGPDTPLITHVSNTQQYSSTRVEVSA